MGVCDCIFEYIDNVNVHSETNASELLENIEEMFLMYGQIQIFNHTLMCCPSRHHYILSIHYILNYHYILNNNRTSR